MKEEIFKIINESVKQLNEISVELVRLNEDKISLMCTLQQSIHELFCLCNIDTNITVRNNIIEITFEKKQ